MRKILFVILGIIIFLPVVSFASVASDFFVNLQPTYDIPYGTDKVLILDLTLPEPPEGQTYKLQSVVLNNAGTADHTVISKLEIWEDGASAGWDNDESPAAKILQAPFFDAAIAGDFRPYAKNDPWRRIFVTVSLKSGFINEKTFKLQLLENSVVFSTTSAAGPADTAVVGPERMIRHNASLPAAPLNPLADRGEALSESAIRWYFIDLSDNEFGFKLLDGNLKVLAEKIEANLSYLDETGLQPNTEYSGRRIVAFNDRGESAVSASSVFPKVLTLSQKPVPATTSNEEVVSAATSSEPEVVQETVKEPTLFETIQAKIAEIQKEISNLINQLDEFIAQSSATIFGALQGFLQTFFGR